MVFVVSAMPRSVQMFIGIGYPENLHQISHVSKQNPNIPLLSYKRSRQADLLRRDRPKTTLQTESRLVEKALTA
jgi:hypothetical protein